MNNTDVLDPLWITKGESGLDSEYCKYIILAANKKYRKLLDNGDTSKFYEILFHSLNLNNLAVEGKIFDFKFKSLTSSEKLEDIRAYLKDMYALPPDLITIFKNSNYLLVNLLIDYLDSMLDNIEKSKVYFVNRHIQAQKEIFIILNKEKTDKYQVYKLKFDGRFKFGHKLIQMDNLEFDSNVDRALQITIDKLELDGYTNMSANKNVVFISNANAKVEDIEIIRSLSNSLVFCRGISKTLPYDSNILDELRETILRDKTIPFTLKSIM
jgi:hypothetical protein